MSIWTGFTHIADLYTDIIFMINLFGIKLIGGVCYYLFIDITFNIKYCWCCYIQMEETASVIFP